MLPVYSSYPLATANFFGSLALSEIVEHSSYMSMIRNKMMQVKQWRVTFHFPPFCIPLIHSTTENSVSVSLFQFSYYNFQLPQFIAIINTGPRVLSLSNSLFKRNCFPNEVCFVLLSHMQQDDKIKAGTSRKLNIHSHPWMVSTAGVTRNTLYNDPAPGCLENTMVP